jgi:hypothetical protein
MSGPMPTGCTDVGRRVLGQIDDLGQPERVLPVGQFSHLATIWDEVE